MTDRKALKNIFLAILGGLILGVGQALIPPPSSAVVIEGFDDTGEFRTVGVSPEGALKVEGSSSVASAVFFVSSQPVNAYQAGGWTVSLSSGISVAVTLSSESTTFTTQVTSCSTISPSVVALAGGSAGSLYAANSARCGSLVCNTDAQVNAWVGPATVTNLNGTLLLPGGCYSPDNPFRFTGALFAYSTAAVSISVQDFTP